MYSFGKIKSGERRYVSRLSVATLSLQILTCVQGLDISKFSQQSRFTFLDCLGTQSDVAAGNALEYAERVIMEAILRVSMNSDNQQVLILDNPDVLLAMQSTTAQQLNLFIMKLGTIVHSIVISCSADLPLVAASTSSNHTPMEVESAAFLTQQGHVAHAVMSVRELSSGAAKDVSGVLRITTQDDAGEAEMLYLVQRDGNVKVFGRGEGDV